MSGVVQPGSIAQAELAERIETDDAPLILDVRSRWEYERGRVPGAVHVPFWRMPAWAPRMEIDRERPVVVYCGHGPRAWFAGSVLRRTGFERVLYLEGHMNAWIDRERPVER